MSPDESDPRRMLNNATDAVRDASAAVQATSDSIARAINERQRSIGLLDQLIRWTRQAPLGSLAVAFAAGLLFARRR